MARKAQTGRKPGRPQIEIEPKLVEGMAAVGATDEEIGDFVGCSGQSIRNHFLDVLTKARSGMRLRLRQAQYKLAVGGNATMMIWLGKQMLGQRDQASLEISPADLADLSDEELEQIAAGIPLRKVLAARARS